MGYTLKAASISREAGAEGVRHKSTGTLFLPFFFLFSQAIFNMKRKSTVEFAILQCCVGLDIRSTYFMDRGSGQCRRLI